MSGPSDAEPLGRHDDTIKKVAYLDAKGEPQKRIAGLLSLSPSMVSRLVDQARKVGLVRETIECELSEPEQQRLHGEVYRGKELLSKLKDVLQGMQDPGRHLRPHSGRLGQQSGRGHGDARPDQPGRFWSGEFFRQGEIDLTKLRRGAFGDLGGTFIIDPSASQADRDYVQAVNQRWTGIKEPHFRRCAVRARENNLPGVTVLAVGHVRAEIVLRCIKLGLINHLVLDSDCAEKLNSLT